jgi:D-alanyl-D-alanine carboxypeptidase
VCAYKRIFVCLLLAINVVAPALAKEKRAALVVIPSGGQRIVYEDRMNARRHPASLTNIMTIYLLFEAIQKGKINFNTRFATSRLASAQMPSKINLRAGEKISVLDIIKALTVQSANDAAVVAAEGLCGSVGAFCHQMNRKAVTLGMRDTHFENPSGVPNKRQITTARDVMTLGMAIYRDFPKFWHFFSLKSFKYKQSTYRAHCKMLNWYKGVDGGKTGYTCASGFNLFVTANRYNKAGESRRVFAVVMGGESGKSRDLYAASLMNKYLAQYTIRDTKQAAKIPAKDGLGQYLDSAPKRLKKAQKPVAKPSESEAVLQEEESISVQEILAAVKISMNYLDRLYAHDEDVVRIEEETLVNP